MRSRKAASPLDVLLRPVDGGDGRFYLSQVLQLGAAAHALLREICRHNQTQVNGDGTVRLQGAAETRVSPSLSEDSWGGSDVLLLLSVFWLQLDGWLLDFLCFLFSATWRRSRF